ncbi:MAG: OmpA family protein [Candidatus Rokuibacteriota bacterium]
MRGGPGRGRRAPLLALAALVAGGCATATAPGSGDLYVLLPDADGKTGAVTVTHGQDQRVLDRPYTTARIAAPGRVEVGQTSEQEVRAMFGPALVAEPPAPVSFTLFFILGTDEIMAESQHVLAQVSSEVMRRPGAEVVVIGHTDRIGSVQQNDALSLQRAERIRRDLLQLGLPPDRVSIAGRGERELLVPTEDEVPEPRNRRVELTIR